jgi:hypothetical protein
MTDDVDPTVSEALRRLAASAPQPREDRLQAVVAGAHRRQLRVIAASALGVVALIAATGFGVQTWRDSAARTPTPVGPVGNPAASASGSLAAQPTGSLDGLAPQSPARFSSPAAQPSPRPSTSVHPTAKATAPKMAADGEVNPKISIELSASHALSGQQIRVTVTIRNESPVIYPKAGVSLGTQYPTDTYTDIPKGCLLADGGAECPLAELQPGHHLTLVFTVTLGDAIGPGVSSHAIFGTYNSTDSRAQPHALQFSAQVLVDSAHSSSPPVSVPPSSPLTSPPSSGPPSSTTPISSSS